MALAHEITKPQNQCKGLNGRVIERKKREPKFRQSLDELLSTALKQSMEYRSTQEILQAVLALDGQDVSLQTNPKWIQPLRIKLVRLEQQILW